jgi:hypothetical protein
MSALENFDTFADEHDYTLYNLVPVQAMDMAGEEIQVWQMRLVGPDGGKVSFVEKTVDEVIAIATSFITSRSSNQEKS